MENRTRLSNALLGNRVPELLADGYEVVTDRVGNPRIRMGDAAIVACIRDRSGRRVALRIVSEFGEGQFWQRHYHSIQDDLPASARLYFPRSIAPILGGITLVGRKMPAVLMEWIDGPTLFDAIDRAAHGGHPHVLEAIGAALRDLSIGLRDSRVTHGDLTPDNLILRPSGDLVCVDLDTLEWPGARKRLHDVQSHSYRHPRKSGTPAHQDAYAILIMFVSTILLSDSPQLRPEFGQPAGEPNGALLFNVWDLRDPESSAAIISMRTQLGTRGRALLKLLVQAARSEAFRAQQFLDEAFDIAALPNAGPAVPTMSPFETAIEPLATDPDEFDVAAAVHRLRELYGQPSAPPTVPGRNYAASWPETAPARTLPPVIEDPMWGEAEPIPTPRVEVVKRPLERLLRRQTPDLSKVLELEAEAARGIDRDIAQLAQTQDDVAVLALAEDAETRQLVLEEVTRRRIRKAQDRQRIRARLDEALTTNDRRDLADLAVSGELALLGDTSRTSLVQVLQALEWPTLLRALETDDDTLIMLWFDEDLFEDERSLPHAMRMRIDLARTRLTWMADVRAALRDRNAEAMELLISNEPMQGRQQLAESERRRVRQLIDGRRALAELDRSIRSGNMERVIAALGMVEATEAIIEDPALWKAVRRIVERTNLIQLAIGAASQSPPDDRALAQIVPQLRQQGIAHDPALRADYSIDRLEAMIIRGAAMRRIRYGIRQNDDRAIRLAAFPDTTGALQLLLPEERQRVELARQQKRVKRVDV